MININIAKNWTISLLAIVLVSGVVSVLVPSHTVFAEDPPSAANGDCGGGFLGFPAWYKGVTDGSCNIVIPSGDNGLRDFIWTIIRNVIEIAAVAMVYITVFFIMYGGIVFLTSLGSPEGAVKGRKTMINAFVGLVISLAAVAIIKLLAILMG